MAKLEFKLDKRIPDEAALLERLRELPQDRHMEYMRNLALKAFLQERAETCRLGDKGSTPAPVRAASNARESQRRRSEPEEQPLEFVNSYQPAQPADGLSLASLKLIVG